jgi:hypothetical protein
MAGISFDNLVFSAADYAVEKRSDKNQIDKGNRH